MGYAAALGEATSAFDVEGLRSGTVGAGDPSDTFTLTPPAVARYRFTTRDASGAGCAAPTDTRIVVKGAGDATLLFYMTEEAQEGRDAYAQRRSPDFAKFPRRP